MLSAYAEDGFDVVLVKTLQVTEARDSLVSDRVDVRIVEVQDVFQVVFDVGVHDSCTS